jgi:hypothetical protein
LIRRTPSKKNELPDAPDDRLVKAHATFMECVRAIAVDSAAEELNPNQDPGLDRTILLVRYLPIIADLAGWLFSGIRHGENI